MQKLTKEQAAIISAYTGILCGSFSDMHEYAERKLGRPILTHEFASPETNQKLQDASRDDFLSICYWGE